MKAIAYISFNFIVMFYWAGQITFKPYVCDHQYVPEGGPLVDSGCYHD